METILPKTLFEGERFFSQPRSCASPDQLHLPGVPHSQEHPQRLRSLPLGCQGEEHEKHDSFKGSLHDPPPLSNLGVAADSGQPSPPHHQRLLQYLHLLLEGPKNYSVFRIVFHCFQGVSLRIPSSDLASWNTFWVVLPLLSVPQSRLCKRLKDSLNKKKGFSG